METTKLELEKKTNEQCIHHWVIDEFNVGRCIKPGCGAVRDFGALMKKQGADIVQARVQSGKRGKKSKRQKKESGKRGRQRR